MNAPKEYMVAWVIEIDADSPEEAALLCRTIQRDPESAATVYNVTEVGGKTYTVDLGHIGNKESNRVHRIH